VPSCAGAHQGIIELLLQYHAPGGSPVKLDCDEWFVSPYPFLIFYRRPEDEIVIHGVVTQLTGRPYRNDP